MKIVICPDSFKGSLTAKEVTQTISESLIEAVPGIEIVELPMADGGEGTAEIICSTKNFMVKNVKTFNAALKPIEPSIYVENHDRMIFIESAEIIGLPLLSPSQRRPLKNSSYGLGITIAHEIKNGYRDFTISLGGSATSDGGMGMAEALGYRFFDKNGSLLRGNGENLDKIASIDSSGSILKRGTCDYNFRMLCDVRNPLFGPQGAALVYAPQKGASPDEAHILDMGLKHFHQINVSSGLCLNETAYVEGAGAAGGLGYGGMVFLDAKLIKGLDFIMDTIDFDNAIKDADLIITGEGKVDAQSLMGKLIGGISERSGKLNIPLVVFAGIAEDTKKLKRAGLDNIYCISDQMMSIEENMSKTKAKQNLINAVKVMVKDNICGLFR